MVYNHLKTLNQLTDSQYFLHWKQAYPVELCVNYKSVGKDDLTGEQMCSAAKLKSFLI